MSGGEVAAICLASYMVITGAFYGILVGKSRERIKAYIQRSRTNELMLWVALMWPVMIPLMFGLHMTSNPPPKPEAKETSGGERSE